MPREKDDACSVVARIERSEIREACARPIAPDLAALNPGYKLDKGGTMVAMTAARPLNPP
jgi:hypothetical protein